MVGCLGLGVDVAEPTGAIGDLLQALTRLPGVGPKSAERMAHALLAGDMSIATGLAEALRKVVATVHPCRDCFVLTDCERCTVCRDPRRDGSLLCVVEQSRDVALFERAGGYTGRYHVLGGRLAPLDGIGPDRLTFGPLVERVRKGGVREVILATSPTLEGDGTALYLGTLLAGTGVTMTKLARGLPSGTSLELANPQMLSDALDGRRAV